jgi:hypothetical protein
LSDDERKEWGNFGKFFFKHRPQAIKDYIKGLDKKEPVSRQTEKQKDPSTAAEKKKEPKEKSRPQSKSEDYVPNGHLPDHVYAEIQ